MNGCNHSWSLSSTIDVALHLWNVDIVLIGRTLNAILAAEFVNLDVSGVRGEVKANVEF